MNTKVVTALSVLLLFAKGALAADNVQSQVLEEQVVVADSSKMKKNVDYGFDLCGELVSSNVFRGYYQCGTSFAPYLSFHVEGFNAMVWGCTDFAAGGYKEADIFLTYSVKGLTVGVYDVWYGGQAGTGNNYSPDNNRYFNFNRHTTDHKLELGLLYTLPFKKAPVEFEWYTAVWGNDRRPDGRQAYSSYFQIAYPFSVRKFDLKALVGCVPYDPWNNYKFAVTNVAFKVAYTIPVSEHFELPIYSTVIWNPYVQDVHVVFGLVFHPKL